LEEIRERKLEELKEYMRANSNDNLETVSEEDLVDRLTTLNEVVDGKNLDEMRKRLKEMETTWHLMIWHDLSTMANHSHLVFMVTCLYNLFSIWTVNTNS
jgi:hypothetical protein